MTPIYLHNWSSKDEMIADFENVYGADKLTDEQKAKYDHVDVILASYGTDNYSGDAFVLFQNNVNGLYYEVNGSHCSCYGPEGQWGEEPCELEVIKHRVLDGRLGSDDYSDNVFKTEILEVLDYLNA